MAEPAAFAQLATILATVDPSPEPAPVRIYADPTEAVNSLDLPCIVLALAPNVDQEFRQETLGQPGLVHHEYVVAMWVILGFFGTGLEEMHQRAKYWPAAIATVLFGHLKLNGSVVKIGYRDTNRLFTYKIGVIPWGNDLYFGLTILLPVREQLSMTVGM